MTITIIIIIIIINVFILPKNQVAGSLLFLVPSRNAPPEGALRDDTENGCVAG